MSELLVARLSKLIGLIAQAGGFGSVTIFIAKGRVARIEWSVTEKLNEPS